MDIITVIPLEEEGENPAKSTVLYHVDEEYEGPTHKCSSCDEPADTMILVQSAGGPEDDEPEFACEEHAGTILIGHLYPLIGC